MASVLEQLACENPAESTIKAALLAPVRSLFNMSQHESLFVYAWLLLIGIWLLVYYVVPASFLNTVNGFKNATRVLVSTLVLFALIVVAYVSWARKAACESKEIKASYYVLGVKPGQPRFLSRGVLRAQSDDPLRQPSEWEPKIRDVLELGAGPQ